MTDGQRTRPSGGSEENLVMVNFIVNASHLVVDQFCSDGLNICEATPMNPFCLISISCMRMYSMSLAFVVSLKRSVKWRNEMTGVEKRRVLIFRGLYWLFQSR